MEFFEGNSPKQFDSLNDSYIIHSVDKLYFGFFYGWCISIGLKIFWKARFRSWMISKFVLSPLIAMRSFDYLLHFPNSVPNSNHVTCRPFARIECIIYDYTHCIAHSKRREHWTHCACLRHEARKCIPWDSQCTKAQ